MIWCFHRQETVRDVCGNMKTGSHLFEDSSFEGIVSMHSASIKTELLQRMDRKITEHCFYTDVELVCYPLVSANTFYVYHEPVYTYRLGREGQSMSIEGIRKHYKEHEKVFWELVDIYKTIPESETAKKILMLPILNTAASWNPWRQGKQSLSALLNW